MRDWEVRAQELVDQHWDYYDVIIPIFIEANHQKFWQAKKDWGQ